MGLFSAWSQVHVGCIQQSLGDLNSLVSFTEEVNKISVQKMKSFLPGICHTLDSLLFPIAVSSTEIQDKEFCPQG